MKKLLFICAVLLFSLDDIEAQNYDRTGVFAEIALGAGGDSDSA